MISDVGLPQPAAQAVCTCSLVLNQVICSLPLEALASQLSLGNWPRLFWIQILRNCFSHLPSAALGAATLVSRACGFMFEELASCSYTFSALFVGDQDLLSHGVSSLLRFRTDALGQVPDLACSFGQRMWSIIVAK